MQVSGRTSAAEIINSIKRWPSGPQGYCINFSGGALTAEDVISLVNYRVDQFRYLGVQPRDVVLLAGGREQQFWIDLLSLWAVGAIPVPIEPAPEPNRLKTILRRAKPQWHAGYVEGLQQGRVSSLQPPPVSHSVGRKPNPIDPFYIAENAETAMILFTSGTTGEPKGVCLSHGAFIGNALACLEVYQLQPMDVLAAAIPFRFVSALSHFLISMLSGATYAGTERSMLPNEFIDYLVAVKATAYGGPPLHTRWIADWLETGRDVAAACRLHRIVSAGDFFSENIGRRLIEILPKCRIVVAYGLTEAAGRVCCRILDSHDLSRQSGDVGQPISGAHIRVVHDDMTECHAGQLGEILIGGSYLMDCYVGDPNKTATVLSEGWFKTGDFGFKSTIGRIVLSGRTDEVFKVAGIKVSSSVLAEVLQSSKMFSDFAIIATPHPTMGSVPHVYFVPVTGKSFEVAELMSYLRKNIPSSHIPWRLQIVEQIPRTGSGKIDRRSMRLIAEQFDVAGITR